ncbi:MAG TPA: lipoprotein [Methylococcaceae bacterium]|nr:lipoprotein [Methylococcaceae bacterium]
MLLRLSVLAAGLLLLLSACGQKGPLFLPTEEPPKKQSR